MCNLLPVLFKYQNLIGQPVSRTSCSPAKPFSYTSATLASFQTKIIWLPYWFFIDLLSVFSWLHNFFLFGEKIRKVLDQMNFGQSFLDQPKFFPHQKLFFPLFLLRKRLALQFGREKFLQLHFAHWPFAMPKQNSYWKCKSKSYSNNFIVDDGVRVSSVIKIDLLSLLYQLQSY